MLTQARLKQRLHYDMETGVFTWVAVPRGRAKAGDEAGWVGSAGYLRIKIDGQSYEASRLACLYVTGAWPTGDVDHANRNTLDNRWCNLRDATTSQNMANRCASRRNTSGVKGVSFDKATGRWRAVIGKDRRQITIGRFRSIDEANAAYQAKARELYGAFALGG